MKWLPVILCALVTSCATTTFYRGGKPVAAFQGDMTGMEFAMDAKGAIRWTARHVDHATPTRAHGDVTTNNITAGGFAVATSGITKFLQ